MPAVSDIRLLRLAGKGVTFRRHTDERFKLSAQLMHFIRAAHGIPRSFNQL